ncbi:F0F1 ATP synthase subunit B [Alphaproteobacteria bacterium]|nr:F0F1 ATP synthase subunit B [Alphaproteobacteria bacterium]
MTNFFNQAETWVAIAFILFIMLILKLGWKNIGKMLDDRAENIKKELDEARNLREEAQSLLADYQRKKRDAEKEASDIINFAKKEAENLITETKKKLEETLQRKSDLANEKIEMAYSQALQSAQTKAIDLAISLSKNLITDNIDASKKSEAIEESIAEIEKSI